MGTLETGTRPARKVGQRMFRLAEEGMRGDLGMAADYPQIAKVGLS